ncbi:MAG: SipW-dependent-type signal peptide-containing protein [Bacilli bacterium]|nr:SipW-dependent-type signal peptide-containing protein [Bacilli bacterium]
MNKKLFAPILSIAALAAVSIGATYALFTDKKEAKVDITAGKVQLGMTSSLEFARSRYEDETPYNAKTSETSAVYENGNTATVTSGATGLTVELDRMTPMDDIGLSVNVVNSSNVKIKWRVGIELNGDLVPALEVVFNGIDYSTTLKERKIYTKWSEVIDPSVTKIVEDGVLHIAFPDRGDADNKYQEKTATIKFFVEAVQGNATTSDPSNYGFLDSYIVDKGLETEHWVHEISNLQEYRNMATFAFKVADGTYAIPAEGAHFCDDKTVYQLKALDLDCLGQSPWFNLSEGKYFEVVPEKTVNNFIFTGIFDGLNHTISNLAANLGMGQTVSGTDCDLGGLFCGIADAEVKNVILDEVTIENSEAKPAGLIAAGYPNKLAAYSTGSHEIKFENITINENCFVHGKQNAAAFIGSARDAVNLTFVDCVNNAEVYTVGSNTGAFAGSVSGGSGRVMKFIRCTNNGNVRADNIVGSFVGSQSGGGTRTFEDCANNGEVFSFANVTCGLYNGQIANSETVNYVGTNINSGDLYVPVNKKDNVKDKGDFKLLTDLTQIHYVGEPDNATKEDLFNKFVKERAFASLTLGFDETTHKITASAANIPAYTKVSLDASIGPIDSFDVATSHMISSGGVTAFTEEAESISNLSFQEMKRVGWVKPSAETATGTYQDAGTIKDKERYEWSMIPFEHADDAKYTSGYHIDSEGGYFVINNKGKTDVFGQIFKIWLKLEIRVCLYDADNNLVGYGYWGSPVPQGGAQTYFSPVYQAD